MGQLIYRAVSSFLTKKERKILMLGIDSAGKTTLLYQMKIKQLIKIVPTVGFNVETVEYNNFRLTIWDISGQEKLRSLWDHYFKGNHALIYVLDSSDSERMKDAKQALEYALQNSEMEGIPMLVLANKQDIAKMSVSEITQRLQLNTVKGVGEWHVQGCCALNGEGVYEGIYWLSNVLDK